MLAMTTRFQNKNLQSTKNQEADPESLSGRSIIVVLSIATATAIFCATVFYKYIQYVSYQFREINVPVEPCVLIALISAVAGILGYTLEKNFSSGNRRHSAGHEDVAG